MNEISFDFFKEHRGIEKRILDLYSIGLKDDFIVFQYRDKTNQFYAQKIEIPKARADGKRKTVWRGEARKVAGFGMHLANPAKHDQLVICEGELDAPSIYQAFNGKIAAVSVPNGAAHAAAKFVRQHLDEFLKFKVIVVATDNDDPGDEAAAKIMELFEPGKVRRAVLLARMQTTRCRRWVAMS